jgi:hypothetical protein
MKRISFYLSILLLLASWNRALAYVLLGMQQVSRGKISYITVSYKCAKLDKWESAKCCRWYAQSLTEQNDTAWQLRQLVCLNGKKHSFQLCCNQQRNDEDTLWSQVVRK